MDETELHDERRHPQSVSEIIVSRIAVHDSTSTRFESVTEPYAAALGYDPETLEGRTLSDLCEEDASPFEAAIERALTGESTVVETVLQTADGDTCHVTLDLDAVTVDDRAHLLSTITSVEAPAADAVPPTSAQRLEVALAGTNTGVWEWDLATGEVIWTESMEQLFGLEPGTFGGTFEAFAERVHPDDLGHLESAIERAVENAEMFETEYRIERADGAQRWVHARGELHYDDAGEGRMIGIVTDITDRKRSEEALRLQEQQYRQLVERLPEAYYTIDEDWRISFCNAALADRLGRPVEEIVGARIWDLFPVAEGTVVERRFRQVREQGEPANFDYQYESGEHLVNVQAYPYEDGIAAVSTDISDQQEALQRILDAAPVILYRFDSDGVFEEMRGQILSQLGLEPEDLIGENIFEVYADHEEVIEAAGRALDGESFRYTTTVEGIALETHYTPLYEDGEVAGVIGVSMDISDLQRQRDRMEFFNSILRHDVLNGMTVIKMRAELLAEELDGEHARYAQTIVDWCNTTTQVTKRVRRVIETLATPDEEQRLEPIDVSAILTRKVGELETAYPEVSFETTVPDGVRVAADELLAEVLGNLLTNSIEHNDTDDLRIETTVEIADERVTIRIADNGRGIEDGRKESVFRRGETSHAKETGSGFGLFFVDVMIEKYGGEIRVTDSEGGGACFEIELATDPAP